MEKKKSRFRVGIGTSKKLESVKIPYQPRNFFLTEGAGKSVLVLNWPPCEWYAHKFKIYDYYKGDYRMAMAQCNREVGESCAFCRYKDYGFKSQEVTTFTILEFSVDENKPLDFDLSGKDFLDAFAVYMRKSIMHVNATARPLWKGQYEKRGDLKNKLFFVQRIPSGGGAKTPACGNDIEYIGVINEKDLPKTVRKYVQTWDSVKDKSEEDVEKIVEQMLTPYDLEQIYPLLNYEDVVKAFAKDEITCYFEGLPRVKLSKEDKDIAEGIIVAEESAEDDIIPVPDEEDEEEVVPKQQKEIEDDDVPF